MKVSLRIRFFLWLLLLLFVFVVVQAVVYGMVEWITLMRHPEMSVIDQLMEVVVGVGMNFILLPFLALAAWWISSYMVRPIGVLASTADEIARGRLDNRVETDSMPDDEMHSLATTLNHAFDQYSEMISRLDRFSADASHQMRTPLASIRAQAELGLTQVRSVEEYQELLGNILDDVRRLSRLTEQLMLMARLDAESQTKAFKDFDLSALVDETATLYRGACEAEGLTLEVDLLDACPVSGNRDLMREALQNLLDNALRYAGPSARVRIQMVEHPTDVCIEVMDTGAGIPEEQAAAIFERFHQVRPARAQGSGLGLALAAQIIRIHGGTIKLVKRAGWGAVFEVCLKKS